MLLLFISPLPVNAMINTVDEFMTIYKDILQEDINAAGQVAAVMNGATEIFSYDELSHRLNDGNWSVSLWAEKLLDEKYNAEWVLGNFAQLAMPRTVGIEVRFAEPWSNYELHY